MSPPFELAAGMYPHLWCIALEEYQQKNLSGPLKGTLFVNGTGVMYSASCQQLKRITIDGMRVSKSWRRYDCEEVILTRPFVTMFPNFVKDTIGTAPPEGQ